MAIAYIIIILILVGLAGSIYFLAHLYLFQVRLRPLHIARDCLDQPYTRHIQVPPPPKGWDKPTPEEIALERELTRLAEIHLELDAP